jgi:hypothetical protein
LRRQTETDDLEGLFETRNRLGGVQSVRVDVHPLAGADAEDGRALGQMRQCHHGLGDQDGMAPDRFGDPDAEAHPPDTGCEIAEQNSVAEKLMRGWALRGKPGQVAVPDDAGKYVLEVVDEHHRVQAHRPGPEKKHPGSAQRWLRSDLKSHRNCRTAVHAVLGLFAEACARCRAALVL